MIKIGKYTIDDWMQDARDVYINDIDYHPDSCIKVVHSDTDRWSLRFEFYGLGTYGIYYVFCLIHGNSFNKGLWFETVEEAKEFVDNTLYTATRFKAFL